MSHVITSDENGCRHEVTMSLHADTVVTGLQESCGQDPRL